MQLMPSLLELSNSFQGAGQPGCLRKGGSTEMPKFAREDQALQPGPNRTGSQPIILVIAKHEQTKSADKSDIIQLASATAALSFSMLASCSLHEHD